MGFGATPDDIEKERQVGTDGPAYAGMVTKSYPAWECGNARPTSYDPHRNWKLDKYHLATSNRLWGSYSFTTAGQSRKASFDLSTTPRFHHHKAFNKDFSQSRTRFNNFDRVCDANTDRRRARNLN